MSELIKSISYKNTSYTVLFREVKSVGTKKYFVTVLDQRGSELVFEMKQNSYGDWKIVAPIPESISALESQLSQILMEENTEHDLSG